MSSFVTSQVPAISDCGLFGTTCDGNTYLQVRRSRATAAFHETRGQGRRAWEGNREHTETHMHARGSVIRHILHAHANASLISTPPSMSNICLTPFPLLIHLPLCAVGTSYTRDSGLRAFVPLSTRRDHFKSAAGRGHRDQGLQSRRLVHAV
jgi:hypothetical protein